MEERMFELKCLCVWKMEGGAGDRGVASVVWE